MTRYLRSANVKDGRLDLSDVLEMNFNPREQSIFSLMPGDVLVSEGSASETQVGANAVWRSELRGVVCFQNTLLRFRARPEVTDPRFLAAWTSHAHRSGKFAAIAGGSSILHIGSERASVMPVLWPSLGEQRRIADLIGALDAKIAALAKEGQAVDDLRRSTLYDLQSAATLADHTTLGTLVDLGGGSIKTGPFGTALKAAEYTPEGVPVISTGEVRAGYLHVHKKTPRVGPAVLGRLSAYILRHGDIVFARKGAVDRSAWVQECEDGYFLGSDGLRVRLGGSPEDSRFVAYLLQTEAVIRWLDVHATGTIMKGLNQKILARIPLALPTPGIRADFTQRLLAIDALRGAAEAELAALDALRSALLGALLDRSVVLPLSYEPRVDEAV